MAAALWKYPERQEKAGAVVSCLFEIEGDMDRLVALQPVSHIQRGYVSGLCCGKTYLDKNQQTFFGTALSMAAVCGDLKLARWLLDRGKAVIEQRTKFKI